MAAVPLLDQAKAERDLAIEDLRDAFSVSYEMAAHRFTNLATEHLGLRTHFVRSDEAGIIWKAYENNDVPFPRNSVGAIEGQRLCREWGTRQVFESDDKYSMHYQYTDTAGGTYWCGTHVDAGREPVAAITVGVGFDDAQFSGAGRPTATRSPTAPTATAAGVLHQTWPGAGRGGRGRRCGPTAMSSPPCRWRPSPVSTSPRSTSSSTATPVNK